jgi:transposase
MPARAVLLVSDATILRWFPPLRYMRAFRGEQAQVKITGENAKRVLFGALNPRTGHRLVLRRFRQRQEDFQAFLRHLRQRYGGRPLWLLLDKASIHQAVASQRLAARLRVKLLWLPKQCPELNPQDHVWKELKRLIVANRQFKTIDDEADHAERWLLDLTPTTVRRKAGVLSRDFWLKDVL